MGAIIRKQTICFRGRTFHSKKGRPRVGPAKKPADSLEKKGAPKPRKNRLRLLGRGQKRPAWISLSDDSSLARGQNHLEKKKKGNRSRFLGSAEKGPGRRRENHLRFFGQHAPNGKTRIFYRAIDLWPPKIRKLSPPRIPQPHEGKKNGLAGGKVEKKWDKAGLRPFLFRAPGPSLTRAIRRGPVPQLAPHCSRPIFRRGPHCFFSTGATFYPTPR